MILVSVKLRLYPNMTQMEQIELTFNHTRFLWNAMLELQNTRHENNKESKFIGKYDLDLILTTLKQEKRWLYDVDHTALQDTNAKLDKSFKRFFKKTGGHPRFKSYKNSKKSYTTKMNMKILDNHHLKIAKMKPIYFRSRKHIPEGKIKTVTVSKSTTGKYYASVVIEQEIEPLPKTGNNVGLDLGLASLSTQSDGIKIPLPRFDKNLANKKRNWERKLARRRTRALSVIHEQKKFGRELELEDFANYTRAKYMVAKYAEKERNQRSDYLQKYTTSLVKDYDVIVMEDLKVKNMMKNHKLARAVANAGWRSMRTMLEYKTKWYGKELIVIDPAYTSQVDFETGEIQKKGLQIREYTNYNGTLVDRDVNAAKNILKWGLDPETRITKA